MKSHVYTRATGVVAAVSILVALVGCAGRAGAGDPPIEAPHASATSTPAADEPHQRFPLTCSQLMSDDAVAHLLGGDIGLVDHRLDPDLSGPTGNAIIQNGGMVCLWSAGSSLDPAQGGSKTPFIRLMVRPDAQQQWDAYAAAYGESALDTRCSDSAGATVAVPTACYLEFMRGGYWVDVSVVGVVGNGIHRPLEKEAVAEVTPAFDSIKSVIGALPAPAPAWTAPSSASALPASPADAAACERFLPIAGVEGALGVKSALAYSRGDGWSLPGTIRTDPAAGSCGIGTAGTEDVLGVVSWLRGGSWGYDRDVRGGEKGPSAPVAGLAPSDSATLECIMAAPNCILELRLGSDWVRVKIFPAATGGPSISAADIAAARANILALGALIVAR